MLAPPTTAAQWPRCRWAEQACSTQRCSCSADVLPQLGLPGPFNFIYLPRQACTCTTGAPSLPCLQGVLTGLFPGTQQPPITVHTSTGEIDEVLYTNVRSCQRLHTLMQDLHRELKGEPGCAAKLQW